MNVTANDLKLYLNPGKKFLCLKYRICFIKSQKGMKLGLKKGEHCLQKCKTIANDLQETSCNSVKCQVRYQCHKIGEKSDWLGSHCNWSSFIMSFNIRERETSYGLIRSPYRQ